MKTTHPDNFALSVINWQRVYGRHNLPWQERRTPYRVWLSEVMLQQTQVNTVLRYYPRFLQSFPDVSSLSNASEDAVLQLWSGLGYYSRARNLHKAAKQIMTQCGGEFPSSAAGLAQLPGVGGSTANAIAAFCYGHREAILDANVRRVLARYCLFDADLANKKALQDLWQIAYRLLPKQSAQLHQDMVSYTQGLMDLGAQVCTLKKPKCNVCPVQSNCGALQTDQQTVLPRRRAKIRKKEQAWFWLVLKNQHGRVFLQKRSAQGIWAGLYTFPSFDSRASLLDVVADLTKRNSICKDIQEQPVLCHALTHRDLRITPVHVDIAESASLSEVLGVGVWMDVAMLQTDGYAVPALVRSCARQQLHADTLLALTEQDTALA